MIRFFVLFTLGLLSVKAVRSQPVLAEVMAGNTNYWYQHSLSRKIQSVNKLGFFHTSSLYAMYKNKSGNELMSQSYLTYDLTPHIKVALGTFYATKPGISASGSVQFRYAVQNFSMMVVPRMDLKKKGAYETMMLIQYTPRLTDQFTFYSRIQLMTNYGNGRHNRSYESFRAGVQFREFVLGIGYSADQRGSEIITSHNWGMFCRVEI